MLDQNGQSIRSAVSQVVNLSVLEDLLCLQDEGEDVIGELVGLFLSDTPQRVAALREALDRGDAQGVSRQAHSIKGGGRNLGLVLAGLAEDLEQRGAAGSLSGAGPVLDRLEEEIRRLRMFHDEGYLTAALAKPQA